MAMTPEAKVKKAVVAVLKEVGAYYFYPVTGGYGASGIFDIVVCYRGVFIGIECKANGGRPTKLQSRNAGIAKSSGCVVLVIDESNIDYVKYVLGKVKEATNDKTEELSGLNLWPFDGVAP